MNRRLPYLLATAIAIAAVLLSMELMSAGREAEAEHARRDAILRQSAGARPRSQSSSEHPSLERELSRPVSRADLRGWLAGKENDRHALARSLVTTGLLTGDPDLVREGIAMAPGDPQLLFIGATLRAFSGDERLALGKRLLEADPDNALAAYLVAAYSLKAGDADAAIQLMQSSPQRQKLDDFREATQLALEEAYIAAGHPPHAAKLSSLFDSSAAHLIELLSLARSLNDLAGSMTPDRASELRSLTAIMGQRLTSHSQSGTLIDHMTGMSLEEATLKDLPGDSPSPYDGLTVDEARASIASERQELQEAIQAYHPHHQQLLDNPELLSRYVDQVRLNGELAAMRWLQNEIE